MQNRPPLQTAAFLPLPIGAVRPIGWLKDQLLVQANGLTGHLEEFWPDVGPDSDWLGGDFRSWERAPYYLDGLLPLAYSLDDEKLKARAQKWIDWVLDNQHSDGWIGPVHAEDCEIRPERAHDLWPVTVMLKVLTQYHDATGDSRVIPAMLRFCKWLTREPEAHPPEDWDPYRRADLALSILWLYNRTGEEWLVGIAGEIHGLGFDWRKHFEDFKFTEKMQMDQCRLSTHVVNNTMAIKDGGVRWLYTGDAGDRALPALMMATLDKYHGQVTGVFSGDEHYAGKNPTQGTELCAVVEYMYSLEVLAGLLGEAAFGDRLESIAYNALPATFKPDMWAHQYDQQANQVLCTLAQRDWSNNGPESNLFGLYPHWRCCLANMHQGWPKFLSHMWMATGDGGLAAVAYGPSEVTAKVAGGKEVTITAETIYPFAETIKMTLRGAGSFPLMLRIPSWCRSPSVRVNGRDVPAGSGEFLTIRRDWSDGDTIELKFPMSIELDSRYHDAVAVRRGPLVYSLKIGEDWRQLRGRLPHADWEVYPTTPWNYGLITDSPEDFAVVETGKVGAVPFAPDAAPVVITARGRRIEQWQMANFSAGTLPQSPVACDGASEQLTLIPYSSTNLRITEFPRLKS